MAALEQINGPNAGTVFEIDVEQFLVGRSEECSVVLNYPSVSRRHCLIRAEDNVYYLRDLGSRNQTGLNGRKIAADSRLMNGDEIQVSTTRFRFLAQDSLSQDSGTWGNRPRLISIDRADDDSEAEEEKSVRRQLVRTGQLLSNAELGSGQLTPGRIVVQLDVADGSGGWPVINNATIKLNQVLQLLYGVRRMITIDEVLGRSLRMLFEVFPLAQNIAVLFRDPNASGIRVGEIVSRHPTEEVQLCLPLIRQTMQQRSAILYADHWKTESVAQNVSGTFKSIMACPLNSSTTFCSGAIQVDCTAEKESFEAADLERLTVLTHVISVLIEQAWESEGRISRLFSQALHDSAVRLHETFQPGRAPHVPGYQLTHALIARESLCTDLVDYVSLTDGRVGVLMIDRTDNSVFGAQDAPLASHILSGALVESGCPARAIALLECELSQRSGTDFDGLSVCAMLLDPDSGIVQFSSAGDFRAYRVRGGEVFQIEPGSATGPPLGLDWQNYTNFDYLLEDGDILSVFCNGVHGICEGDRDLIGIARFAELLHELAGDNEVSFPVAVCHRLKEYQSSELLLDDIAFTMLARTTDVLVADEDVAIMIESGTTKA